MEDLELAQELLNAKKNVVAEIQKVIIGQDEVIENLLAALFSKGHCLFVGVPGLAKTLLVSTLAQVLNLGFSRIQFTPDLMPSDITGTDILHEDSASGESFRRSGKKPAGPSQPRGRQEPPCSAGRSQLNPECRSRPRWIGFFPCPLASSYPEVNC